MGYIRKHWNGELSLAVSFWVNVALLNIVFVFIDSQSAPYIETLSSVTAARVALALILIQLLLIYPWQIVGAWRSASNYSENNEKAWGGVAKFMIVLGLLSTLGSLNLEKDLYKTLFTLAFTKDEFSERTVELIRNDSLIKYSGGIGFGSSEDVRKLLESHAEVEGIILNSYGGRVEEAQKIARLVTEYSLDTYSFDGCLSACGTIFIAGKKRYLVQGANIGFHEYSYGGSSPTLDALIESSQEADKHFFISQGINPEIVERIFQASPDELWYPTNKELLSSGIVHELINESSIEKTNYGEADENLKKLLSSIPFFSSLQKYDPIQYEQLVTLLRTAFKQGKSTVEVQVIVTDTMGNLVLERLALTSDDALLNFFTESLVVYELLRDIDPILCVKMVSPEVYGPVEFTRYLSKEEMMPFMDAMSEVIIDSYENPGNAANPETAQLAVELITMSMEEELKYIDMPASTPDDYKMLCNAFIHFFEAILDTEKGNAANVFRWSMTIELENSK